MFFRQPKASDTMLSLIHAIAAIGRHTYTFYQMEFSEMCITNACNLFYVLHYSEVISNTHSKKEPTRLDHPHHGNFQESLTWDILTVMAKSYHAT